MKWFTGEVSSAIQKAIQEKKVFIVFVKDDKDNSTKMEGVWNDDEVAEVCTEEKCVAINILAGSVPGQQFGAIYPILCVPSTYLINNQGTPTDIIPGVLEKEEFIQRLKDGIGKTLLPSNTDDINKEEATTSSSSTGEHRSPQVSTHWTGSKKTVGEDTNDDRDAELTTQEKVGEDTNDDRDAELTTQEKVQMERLRKKLKVRKEEEENQKAKDMEKKRRETGQDIQHAQRQIAERQAMELAKEIADRKSEEKAARDKVREQIKQDRLDKTKRFDKEKKEREELTRKKTEAVTAQTEKKKADSSNTARLQFRLPDGASVSNQFNAEAKFLVAEGFIKDHLQLSSVRLTTLYPKHEFDSDDMLKSFRELGLVPNASIIVSSDRSATTSKLSSLSLNPMSFIMFVLAPILAIFSWVASFFTGNYNNRSQPAQQTTSPSQSQQSTSSRDDSVRRRNIPTGSPLRNNMQRLRHDDDDDENATWNGNSTQQM